MSDCPILLAHVAILLHATVVGMLPALVRVIYMLLSSRVLRKTLQLVPPAVILGMHDPSGQAFNEVHDA